MIGFIPLHTATTPSSVGTVQSPCTGQFVDGRGAIGSMFSLASQRRILWRTHIFWNESQRARSSGNACSTFSKRADADASRPATSSSARSLLSFTEPMNSALSR